MNLAGGASFCRRRRRRRLAGSEKRVGDSRGAGEGGFCFATSLPVRARGGGCRLGRPDDAGVGDPPARDSPPGPEYVCADPLPCPPLPEASPEGVSGRPALRGAETPLHRFRATL